MITLEKGYLLLHLSTKQSQTESDVLITEQSHVSVLLNYYQTFANFVDILYAYNS